MPRRKSTCTASTLKTKDCYNMPLQHGQNYKPKYKIAIDII